jgi:hypothetical protein
MVERAEWPVGADLSPVRFLLAGSALGSRSRATHPNTGAGTFRDDPRVSAPARRARH